MEESSRKKVNAAEYISPYFREAWGIAENAELVSEYVSPETLFSADRLDLACKLYYVECFDKGLDMGYARKLYRASIAAFSDGAYIEPGLNTKNGIADYFSCFEKLICDMRENGFDAEKSLIPVGENGAILDGAHRVAIAIYYGFKLPVIKIPNKSCSYNYAYFTEKGMSAEMLDFMAYQYIRYTEQVYTLCLWPSAYDEKKLPQVEKLIEKSCTVAYKKQIKLNYHGVEQLMTGFYRHMEWTGNIDNGFAGVAGKARCCYKKGCPLTLYVISGKPLNEVLELKNRIRDVYAISNDSVHITDTQAEAVEAGKMLLNKNSVYFLNYGKPFDKPELLKMLEANEAPENAETAAALFGIEGISAECSENTLTNPENCSYFWGHRLPSLSFIKEKGSENDKRAVRDFEKSIRKAASAKIDDFKLSLFKLFALISAFFSNASCSIKRASRVLLHRLRYRGQNEGKAELDVKDLQAVFLNLNTTSCDYLVMRNWEGFFDDILLEGHKDIDVLCRDRDSRDILVRFLDAKPLSLDGFHYEFKYKGKAVTLDTRIMGDGYYDRRWQRAMLKSKKLHPLGFYIMDSENYLYSLMYHAIYQKKNGLSAEYGERLSKMAMSDRALTQNDFAEMLGEYMHKKRYACTETLDRSVIKAFDNTTVEKKRRYPLYIRLRHGIERIKSKRLYERLKVKIRNLIIRG